MKPLLATSIILLVGIGAGCVSVDNAKNQQVVGQVLEIHMLGKLDETVTICHFDPRYVVSVQTQSDIRKLAIHSPAKTFMGLNPVGRTYMFTLSKSGSQFLLDGVNEIVSATNAPTAESSLPNPQQLKNAIISYIDTHHGYFIGREDSIKLKSEPIVLWGKDTEGSPVYSMVEFLIYPKKMYFHANYGMESIEPYLYKGEFIRTKDGGITVGNINLTRLHMDAPPAGK